MATLGFLVGLMVGALRLPVDEAAAATEVWTGPLIGAVALATVLGITVVLALDHYSDSLDYTEDTDI
jgi:putative membrane protein